MSLNKKKEYKEKHFVIENPPPVDSLKYIEMQLNKSNLIMAKAKMACIKLDKVFVMIPYTYSKIELRMRNILTNHRDTLDAISHFMNFYLINKSYHDLLKAKYLEFIKY